MPLLKNTFLSVSSSSYACCQWKEGIGQPCKGHCRILWQVSYLLQLPVWCLHATRLQWHKWALSLIVVSDWSVVVEGVALWRIGAENYSPNTKGLWQLGKISAVTSHSEVTSRMQNWLRGCKCFRLLQRTPVRFVPSTHICSSQPQLLRVHTAVVEDPIPAPTSAAHNCM